MHKCSLAAIHLAAALTSTAAGADETRRPAFEGSLTATLQGAGDGAVATELQGSLDLTTLVPLGPGDLTVFVEGSTTPAHDGLSALIPEANNDAGSALDRDDKGRLQVSEIFYTLAFARSSISLGLLDPTAFLDTSAVANDETTQFLAGPLVNNPTIDFPDYTLAVHLGREPDESGVGFNLLLGGSNGLGDNEDRSYSELLDPGAKGKGIFAAGEGVWRGGLLTARLGTWINTSDHERLDGGASGEDNYGVYGVLDGPIGKGAWTLRVGWADPRVSEATSLASGALEYPLGPATLGLGIAHVRVSDDVHPAAHDTTLTELYARFDLSSYLQITPLVQYVRYPGFGAAEEAPDRDQWVSGVRVNVPF